MKSKLTFIYLIFVFLTSCTRKLFPIISYQQQFITNSLTDWKKKNWQKLDLEIDSISGVSLNRTYKEIIKNKKGKDLIIAVLDTETDIDHEDIKNNIWTNHKEIPNNNIDDDKNGYIDDIHGWNFLSNNYGESIINHSYECLRVLNYFKKNKISSHKDSILFEKAKVNRNELNKTFLIEKKRIDFYKSVFPRCFKTIKQYFPNGVYNREQIDSLYKYYEKKGDKNLYHDLYLLNELKKSNLDSTWVSNSIKSFDYDEQTIYNENYNEKEVTKDDLYNLKDSVYGSKNISKYAKKTWHGTQVTGLINSCYLGHNNINIKIMPIVISSLGGENNDKDILIAFKYAVNNGAKVINMSSGKHLSLHPEWLKEALLYAEKKDVLVITSAGNSRKNVDNEYRYLLDYDEETQKEFCENMIKVGGTSHDLGKNILLKSSNFGQNSVDIFAPSEDIYVPDATEGHTFNSGTSLGAAIVSGIAGLIRSYYPKLTAAQVKQIIMDSGVSYDIEVIVPGTKDKKVKFSELSKSGKVVNVYNAMKMAKKTSN